MRLWEVIRKKFLNIFSIFGVSLILDIRFDFILRIFSLDLKLNIINDFSKFFIDACYLNRHMKFLSIINGNWFFFKKLKIIDTFDVLSLKNNFETLQIILINLQKKALKLPFIIIGILSTLFCWQLTKELFLKKGFPFFF